MEHISAMGIATARVSKLTPMKLKTITGGPPEVTPTMNTPLSAVHLMKLLDTSLFFFRLRQGHPRCHNTEAETNHGQQPKRTLEL